MHSSGTIPAVISQPSPAKLLRLPDVAERLDISEPSVRRLIEGGHLESTDVGAGPGRRPRLRVSEQAVADFLAARTITRPLRRPTDPPQPPG